MLITQKQAVEYVELGVILSAGVLVEPFGEPGWSIEFYGKLDGPSFTLRTDRGESRRVFKTIDSAVRVLREVGFQASLLSVTS